jgi:hypothetical protein
VTCEIECEVKQTRSADGWMTLGCDDCDQRAISADISRLEPEDVGHAFGRFAPRRVREGT